MTLTIGDKLKLDVIRLGIHGEGVAHYGGLVCFIPGALTGEAVLAEVIEVKKSYASLKLLKILTPSIDRVDPPCPLFGTCGGCQVQHLSYKAQLEMKRSRVIDAFQRIGKLQVEVDACQSSPKELHYRNKIQMPSKGGKLGLFRMGSNDWVEVDKCLIHCDLGEMVLRAIRPIEIPDLRYLVLKTAIKTNEVLVVPVVRRPLSKSIAEKIYRSLPEIKGVVQNLNPDAGNTILSRNFETLAGRGTITERILDLEFHVSPASFFQVNPAQAEALYSTALDRAQLKGDEVVLDAFCGVGTLALIFAKHAKEIIGVEIVAEAIKDAKANAINNGIINAQFYHAPAEKFIQKLSAVDVVLLNPPRKGCDLSVIQKLLELKPKKIIYVSCDPATLARDSALLSGTYRIDSVTPFDMFPQTAHVETLVELNLSSIPRSTL
ncbi:MAG: 23S rRNA (uracil(1939)-C(5))-methyltransferase RlmD [Chlamydiia bacterium]|nr:23S rRNA (uracil(1939)-C(5))-methyltransferase RlmD [Chlamydiia bacterium]